MLQKSEDRKEAIVEQIAAKHQKTSEGQENNEDDMTECERIPEEDARKFIAGLDFISGRNPVIEALHLHKKPVLILFSCS